MLLFILACDIILKSKKETLNNYFKGVINVNKIVINIIEHYNPKAIIFDIDGTLKDLCKEHTNAVKLTLKQFRIGGLRQSIILAIHRVAMFIVKTGFLPTNHSKQNFLVKVYALIAGVKIVEFYDQYFENYTKELCLFDGVYELLTSLNVQKDVYFATINKQNYNLEECGIPQERIMYTEGAFKAATYNKLLKSFNLEKYEVIIVGDNIFDDLFSAKQLGVNCFLVNRYNNKLKSTICRLVNGRYLK